MPKATHIVGFGVDARGAGTPRRRRGFGPNLPLLRTGTLVPANGWCNEAQNFPPL